MLKTFGSTLFEKALNVDVPFRTLVFNDLRTIAELCEPSADESAISRLKQTVSSLTARFRRRPPSTGP